MFNMTKIILIAAMVAGSTLVATAATKNHAANAQAASYNVIPGYDSQGRTVGIPNPDRRGQ